MKTNQPWNWTVTELKTIKIMLVRPPMTNFKMTVRADSAVSACSSLPLSVKALASWLSLGWEASRPLDRRLPSQHHPCLLAYKIKQTFLSTWPLYWLLSKEQPDPTFSYIRGIQKYCSWVSTNYLFIINELIIWYKSRNEWMKGTRIQASGEDWWCSSHGWGSTCLRL